MAYVIRTVAGDIPAEALGWCHAHEHLMVRKGGPWEAIDPNLSIDRYEDSLKELKDFRAAGGGAVADAQPVGAGRKCRDLKRLSGESGVGIIASTGFHMRKFYPADSRIFALTPEAAGDLFRTELTQGMFDGTDPDFDAEKTDIKAGLIKTALAKPEEFGAYRSLFEAAAYASTACGATIMVHTEKGADIPGFLDFMEDLGVVGDRLILCHMDRTCGDMGIHREAARRGTYLDYDTVGRYKYHDDRTECGILREMLEEGYEDRILLGLDTTAGRLKYYGGTPGLCFILEEFREIAADFGIEKKTFDKFMIENPARAFRFGKQEET